MVSNYRKILEEIRKAEEILKNSESASLKFEDKILEKRIFLIRNDIEAIEDYKNLKENITASIQNNHSPAFLPATVKNAGWQDY